MTSHLRTVADRKLQIYFQSTGNPACGSEWMMGDTKQHAACCCTALGVNVANFMLSSFYNCNVANMFERAGVRSCVGTFSSSIHVLSMAQSAKYTLHLLLLQVFSYILHSWAPAPCPQYQVPSQGGCMLPSSSGIMTKWSTCWCPLHLAAQARDHRTKHRVSEARTWNRSIVENNRLETHDSAHLQSCWDGWCGRASLT